MKYVSIVIICFLLHAAYAFDMKYSLIKHEWNPFIPKLINDGNIDIHKSMYYYIPSLKRSLANTTLAGRVTLSDSYILVANINVKSPPSCIFSMKRKDQQKLELCLEPAGYIPLRGNNAVTVTLYSANIPDGKLSFGHKIMKNQWTEIILSVNKRGITQIVNCSVTEEKRFNTNITGLVRLTDDMDLQIVPGANRFFEIGIRQLDLYTPVDATTLMSLCPNLPSDQFRGEDGERGSKGEKGERGVTGLKGDTGNKGEVGERGIDIIGSKGEKGERGPGGMKGEDWVQGVIGERGEPGLPAPPAPSCPATVLAPAATAELDTLKAILGDIKAIFADFIVEKKEQMKYFAEITTKYNERIADWERNIAITNNNIDVLKTAILTKAEI